MKAANIVASGAVFPRPRPAPLSLPDGTGPPSVQAFQADEASWRGLIAPARLRRMGRAQRMALAAAYGAMSRVTQAGIDPEDITVSVGTGMGELEETMAFLENMIALEEREPRPAKFINSVHNSLAAQIAIEFGLTGENHTFTQRSVSFEAALWQAIRCIGTGRADMALACGADALNPYAIAAGLSLGIWGRGESDFSTPDPGRPGGAPGVPGEGAAAFMLAREGLGMPVIARVTALEFRPVDPEAFGSSAEARFIGRVLMSEGLSVPDFQVLLLGANGDPRTDRLYMGVVDTLGREHPGLALATYKPCCGDFCTASALGLALAVRAVREGCLPEGIALLGAGECAGRVAGVLLYHLSPAGYRSLCAVSL